MRLIHTCNLLMAGNICVGISPACAGNIGYRHAVISRAWDQPRACGEHQQVGGYGRDKGGSAPRVRGTSIP